MKSWRLWEQAGWEKSTVRGIPGLGVRLARLTEIRRQTGPGYKRAVEAISQGTGKAAQKGFDALDKMGRVIEAAGDGRHSLLVADYLNAVEDGKFALIIAPTHSEGQMLTGGLPVADGLRSGEFTSPTQMAA